MPISIELNLANVRTSVSNILLQFRIASIINNISRGESYYDEV